MEGGGEAKEIHSGWEGYLEGLAGLGFADYIRSR